MDDELTVDEFIRGRMKKVVDGGIGTMIESRAKSFVNELRKGMIWRSLPLSWII